MATTLTLICTEADDPDQFEAMTLAERRERCSGWKTFPLRSRRHLDTFLMKATRADLGVFASADRPVDDDGVAVITSMISTGGIAGVIADLEVLVQQRAVETAQALVAHGGGHANVEKVVQALTTGAWPASGDAAEEAAAFAFQLLTYARYALSDLRGLCWEIRGEVTL